MKHLVRTILLAALFIAAPAYALAQSGGSAASTTDQQARKQAERDRKEAERRRKEEEKEAQRLAGVRCSRLQRKR